MSRPRAFDEEKVLEAAAACFWARGFAATSVRDLAGAMGITGASLYNAYGDKRGVFEAALYYYWNTGARARMAAIEAQTSGLAAIEAFFAAGIERATADCERKGCLIVNSALDVAPHDPGLANVIAGYLMEMKSFFVWHIQTAIERGECPKPINPHAHAANLLAVHMGLRALSRCYPDRAFLEAAVAPALAALRNHSDKEEVA
ncbi:regulatory protein TetR [Rhodomicrobium vannielii ATCC 17100]|uniref:Regulatory protein TetR n=1 Tax=Rhodomicrobium vannielii (strain ATCC 17100 / DSM 162 / LMG 4299 / NCIMB 10020 / ATH 3.1.1) TaxID=648757 RepID=E3I7T7_RHOVT|nr:TetR/AcrR family transcriptional regulator [Rhodomicrobium vannielii]ADP70791.1 regulatory protein TetR [Rhodomicrobium vannielii ATCC 17100]